MKNSIRYFVSTTVTISLLGLALKNKMSFDIRDKHDTGDSLTPPCKPYSNPQCMDVAGCLILGVLGIISKQAGGILD